MKNFNDRNDVRYSHPSIRAFHETRIAANSKASMMAFADESVPLEERHKVYVEQVFPLIKQYGFPVPDTAKKITIPGQEGVVEGIENPISIELTIVYPPNYNPKKKYPCILSIPGGALQCSSSGANNVADIAENTGAIVAVFDYRTLLVDMAKYPAAIDDCHWVYKYIHDHADELGIRKNKIIIHGASSGGHLALSLCHRLKKWGYAPRGCVVVVPVVDERTIYPSSKILDNDWDGDLVYHCMLPWLNNMPSHAVPAEAFPNHATVEECIGLPPTVIFTTQNEPCVDPCFEYYSKLNQAGVFASIHVYGGSGHATMSGEPTDYSINFNQQQFFAIRDLIEYDNTRPWTLEE